MTNTISKEKIAELKQVLLDTASNAVISDVEDLPLGRSRENYKVTLEGRDKPVVVTLFNQQNHTYTPTYQAKMQKKLHEIGVHVPNALGWRESGNGKKAATISQFIEGKYHKTLSETHLKSAATEIAKFHAAIDKVTPPDEKDFNPKNDSAKTRKDTIGDYMERLKAEGVDQNNPTTLVSKTAFDDNVANKDRNLPKGLTHGDLRPENFLFSEDGNDMALLDLERAKHGGEMLFDLATFISKSIVIAELQVDSSPESQARVAQKVEAFVKSYNEKRPLTPDELEALPEYIQSRTFYVTALRSGLAESKPELHIDVKTGLGIQDNLQQYLQRTNFKEMLGVDEKAKVQDPEPLGPERFIKEFASDGLAL